MLDLYNLVSTWLYASVILQKTPPMSSEVVRYRFSGSCLWTTSPWMESHVALITAYASPVYLIVFSIIGNVYMCQERPRPGS